MKYGYTSSSLVQYLNLIKQCRGHHEKVGQLSLVNRMMGRKQKYLGGRVGGMPNSQQYITSNVC